MNYCDENHDIEIAVKGIDRLFNLASEIIKADRLHLFFLSDGTRIDDNEYLESLENGIRKTPTLKIPTRKIPTHQLPLEDCHPENSHPESSHLEFSHPCF